MNVKILNLRLSPGDDLKKSLVAFAQQNSLKASVVISGIGSLIKVQIRAAGNSKTTLHNSKHEILSLNGTLSDSGVHLHICIANELGQAMGGHLLEGCEIYTTAEVSIIEQLEVQFLRLPDPQTGYSELVITKRI